MVNQPVRKKKTVFTAEERVAFLEAEVEKLGNVQVKPFDNLLVDFARENGAKTIVKGLRAISDFEYEFEMNQLNRKMAPDIESMYLMSAPAVQLPLVERRQGAGDVRRRSERPGASAGSLSLAGSAQALKN